MSDTVLNVKDLQVQFKTDEQVVKAVDGISFEVKRGQTLGIVGESGSGKSVTSLAVMGLVPAPGAITGGQILFQGREDQRAPVDLAQLPTRRLEDYRGGEISMIFQEPMTSLNPVYTIGFQLIEAITLHKRLSKADAEKEAIARLQEVRLLPSNEQLHQQFNGDQREIDRYKYAFLNRYPHELSGGQMQRVMIAMAISCDPALLIADEPTTALDVTVQAEILELLRQLCTDLQMSLIFVSHDLDVVASIADRVAVMYQGKIVEQGMVRDMFERPQHPYTRGLLTCRPPLDRHPDVLLTVADYMDVVTLASGEVKIEAKQPPIPNEVSLEMLAARLEQLVQQSPLLSVQNLDVTFPIRGVLGMAQRSLKAVNGVTFEVYPGETLGLVGESGCGKTTLARALLRLVEPTAGQVIFDGQNVRQLRGNALRRLRREMQIIFQNPFSSLDPRMSVGDAVMEPLVIHSQGKTKRERRDRAVYLLEKVGLSADALTRYPHQFSGGQRQRICIARALALQPKFIICDESVSALDVSVQAQVLNLLKALQAEFHLTYIFISHDLSVVKFMSDRIMVMNRGDIEEIGAADQIYRNPAKQYTQKLIAAIPKGLR